MSRLDGISTKATLDLFSSGSPALLTAVILLGFGLAILTFYKSTLHNRVPDAQLKRKAYHKEFELDINKDRQLGEWTPIQFCYPLIEPCKEKIVDIKPIPYRPFRWGAYHVTMGIRNMEWNDWIELDKDHERYYHIKLHRVQTRGDKAVRVLGDELNQGAVRGGAEAAVELVHELSEYLSRRYPGEFRVVRHRQEDRSTEPAKAFSDWGWEDLPPIKSITVSSLGVSFDLPLSVDDGIRSPERAMEIAGLLIQDDLAIMIEGADGRYYFQAGSICLAGFWRMEDKIGMPLDDIHLTGNVPQYQERLHASLERFFRRLPVEKPVIRNNYFIQTKQPEEMVVEERVHEIDPEEISWATSTLGEENEFEHGTHGTAKPKGEERHGEAKIDWLRLRTERQTLRRIPKSGAVVFTIRTYLTPMAKLALERGVPGRMASALRSWPADVAAYKGQARGGWWDPLLRYMDEAHAGQLERGEIQDSRRENVYPL